MKVRESGTFEAVQWMKPGDSKYVVAASAAKEAMGDDFPSVSGFDRISPNHNLDLIGVCRPKDKPTGQVVLPRDWIITNDKDEQDIRHYTDKDFKTAFVAVPLQPVSIKAADELFLIWERLFKQTKFYLETMKPSGAELLLEEYAEFMKDLDAAIKKDRFQDTVLKDTAFFAKKLCDQIGYVSRHPLYKKVWECHQKELGDYRGPTFAEERRDLEACLTHLKSTVLHYSEHVRGDIFIVAVDLDTAAPKPVPVEEAKNAGNT